MKDNENLTGRSFSVDAGTANSGQILTGSDTGTTTTNYNGIRTFPALDGSSISSGDTGINWVDSALTLESDVTLGMRDLLELLQTAPNRGEILLAYGQMILDKLLSMPNEGGLNIPGLEMLSGPTPLGYQLAKELAIGWNMTFRSLVASRVYKDGSFEFLIKI